MTINEQIKDGADGLISFSAATSKGEPFLAIAQLLTAATSLAHVLELSKDEFMDAVNLALDDYK